MVVILKGPLKNLIVKKVLVNRCDLRIKVSDKITSVLNNIKVTKVTRRAKFCIIHFENNYSIIFHLGMSGRIVIDRKVFAPLEKHDHITIELFKKNNKNFNLRFSFRDPRRFGFFNIYKTNSDEYKNYLSFLVLNR